MPHHQTNEVKAAVRPSAHELEVAADVILAELADGMDHTANLLQAVIQRLDGEPLDELVLEGVEDRAIRRARSTGATILALANLEATGHVLPLGESRVHQWDGMTIPYNFGGVGAGYRTGDQFNYSVAEVYVLPLAGIASDAEAPFVFLEKLPSSMGPKVRRVLIEAVNAYRARTFIGTAALLATASEAAWEQVANKLVAAGDTTLVKSLSDPNTSAARIQTLALQAMAQQKLADAGVLASLGTTAQAYRDVRNHAVHEPEKTFDEQLFARAAVGILLGGAVFYFRRLYEAHDRIT